MPEATAHQLQRTVDEITGYSRRTRKLIWGLALSIVIDIALTVIIAFLTASALNANSTLHKAQLTACGIGNQSRLQQIRLWDEVLAVSKPANAHEAQVDRQFRAFVSTTFAPVDCAKLYR